MRSSRLLSLLLLLQARGRMSASEIAQEFEVSIRTVYRDIDALSAAGIPVYGESGPGGGFQFHDGYRAGLTGLTIDEASALLLAGFPQAIEVFGLGAQADLARKKVAASLQDTAIKVDLAQRIHLDPDPWYNRHPPPHHLAAVVRAVVDCAQLQLEYESWRKTSRPVVDPLGLVLKAGSWYLVADWQGRPTTFRISSIVWLRTTGKTIAPRGDFHLAGYWRDRCDAFEASLKRITATVRVREEALHRLERLGSVAQQAFHEAEGDGSKWRTVSIPIESIDHAAAEFLSLGDCFEIVEPEPLRQEIARLARTAWERHAVTDRE